ncbi:MAG TPA: response regulator [Gemmata sp.]
MSRLLLVEDEPANREMFRRRLERKGYVVITAENGSSAVALTQSEKPDLVLMDLGLPDIDGWEATRRVKGDPATAPIPVIVLSAHVTSDAREKALAAGCQDFEPKPVNWDVLFRKVEEWLAKAKEEAARRAADLVNAVARAAPHPAGAQAPTGEFPSLSAAKHPEKEVCAVAPKRILVVEDNDANRVMLCRRLNNRGYVTVEAANGREALAAVRAGAFDLVLCDIMMPEVDGYEVLTALKADPELQALPVIMISALDEMAGVARCIEMGAEDYLQKPYDPVLLHARVNACLDKRRLRDQESADRDAVAALTRAAELVERGQFDPALLAPVAARDDALGTLARVFDRMAREVQARVEQFQTDVQRLTKVETEYREVIHAVSQSTADGFEQARRHATAALARQPGAPNSMSDTKIIEKLPK